MFTISVDLGDLLNLEQEITKNAKQTMKEQGARLQAMTYAHIVEQANKKLHSRREMYIKGLKTMQLNDDTFVIHLDASVMWIEEGMKAHNMVDDLLKSKKAKTAADGSKYAAIPFKQNKAPTQSTPAQKSLMDTIKKEFKERKINYGGIEKDPNGNPKLGLIHKLDIKHGPTKQANAPGQGKGPIGKPMQGPTGIPFLQGIRVYQREVTGADGKKSVKKDIMTFRVVSSKHKDQGRWDYPGIEGVKLFDEAADWAKRTWETQIVPQISQQLNSKK